MPAKHMVTLLMAACACCHGAVSIHHKLVLMNSAVPAQKLDHNLKDCGKDADEVTECICNLCAA